jgi:AmmeMemoRadiSam system protein B
MTIRIRHARLTAATRQPAVAGSFYPGERQRLAALVDSLMAEAERVAGGDGAAVGLGGPLLGLLVPHAGLQYSGGIAAAGWRLVGRSAPGGPITVVILGTNHGAGWFDGVGVWEAGAWRTPLGDLDVDGGLARDIVELGPPFVVDRGVHLDEHSIEVQLPLLQAVRPVVRIVPLSVAAGTGAAAVRAGHRLGTRLAAETSADGSVVVAISSDMAHYPPSSECARVTAELLPSILELDPETLVGRESMLASDRHPGLLCGMCGIQPAVLGLAALRAMGATRGIRLADATSADAGGSSDRTVGYLAAAFTT